MEDPSGAFGCSFFYTRNSQIVQFVYCQSDPTNSILDSNSCWNHPYTSNNGGYVLSKLNVLGVRESMG